MRFNYFSRLFAVDLTCQSELLLTYEQSFGLARAAQWVYLILAGIHLLVIEEPHFAWGMSAIALCSSACLGWALYHFAKLKVKTAKSVAMIHRLGAVIISGNVLCHIYLEQSILNSSMMLLVLMVYGAFMLERWLFLAASVVSVSIWLALVLPLSGLTPELTHYCFGVCFSAMVGWTIMEHRRRLLENLMSRNVTCRSLRM